MHGQTKWESFVEQLFNIGSGFIFSLLVWVYIVNPLISSGVLTIDDSLQITAIFTVFSVVRSFLWRRVFNHISKGNQEPYCSHVPHECVTCRKDRILQMNFKEGRDYGN
jgi:hypothetical protein